MFYERRFDESDEEFWWEAEEDDPWGEPAVYLAQQPDAREARRKKRHIVSTAAVEADELFVYDDEPVYQPAYQPYYEPVYRSVVTAQPTSYPSADVISIGAVLLVVIMLLGAWWQLSRAAPPPTPTPIPLPVGNAPQPTPTPERDDPTLVMAPYIAEYWITQGVHGTSYGHAAIDIAAGEGTTIVSPINGVIVGNYIDQYGNTTLLIENEVYLVTLLHGLYTILEGERARIGQPVGTESNIGYTMDMQGNLCWNRECGYHTHLNIFDKQLQQNVNPLDLID